MNICFRDECTNEAKNKYCSKSCAAKVNNIGVSRNNSGKVRITNCANCHSPLNSNQYKFCSLKCQQSLAKHNRIDKWLLTGTCVVGSGHNHYVRDYIRKEQNGICALCPTKTEWLGKPLVLVLDHIDGNSENNQRENLRLICPNCDSQLDTYKSKNKGNGRHYRRTRYANGQSY